MNSRGYSGDWRIYECSSDECETEVQEPHTENPNKTGFTMESLEIASDYGQE